MSKPIYFIDRQTGEKRKEAIYGQKSLEFLYGPAGKLFASFLARTPFFSSLYGFLQRQPWSKRKIPSFIQRFGIDEKEFLLPKEAYSSFNDFFTRRLKPSCRPLAQGEHICVMPADGRYLFYPHLKNVDGIVIKGKTFDLNTLLQSPALARHYSAGSLVIARLCPTDYHRFHFPCSCIPSGPQPISGPLFSVNPLAVRKNLSYLFENKRVITQLKTDAFGTIVFIEIGATNVGTIHQTFVPHQKYEKGAEKGYFSFGGSSLVMLFEEGAISFDADLLKASSSHQEIFCRMGESMGQKS